MLCVFGTVIFLLEGSIKRSTANLQIPRKKRDEYGNANNVIFYAIFAHPSHLQFLLKSQKTKVTNTQLKISYSKHNMSHIGFRTFEIFVSITLDTLICMDIDIKGMSV